MDTDTREALAALPPLPEPVQYEHREPRERYTAEQMRTYALAALAIPLDAERERVLIALREWAVSRWRAEVAQRPLENKHRRSLDDCWRQVMRYAGIDPDEVVGPSHDALLAAASDPRSGMLAGDALAGGA